MPATAPPLHPPPPPRSLAADSALILLGSNPACIRASGGAGALPTAPHSLSDPLLSAFPWASWRPRPKPLLDTLAAGTETQVSIEASLAPSRGQLPTAP